ncbi:MAG: 3-hydroxyacyl-ACP dehydratase FabZ [Desulfovibrionaceae bacterium]
MTETGVKSIRIGEIMDLLPHRYPFLLVDRIVEYVPGQSLTAYKNVTINEPFFQGHFPNAPVMPGVLILEALAQAGGLLVCLSAPEPLVNKLFMFTGIEKVRFRKPVVPGDQLMLRCFDIKQRMQLSKMTAQATVDGTLVCEAVLSAAVIDKENV